MLKAVKFGGSSLADADRFRAAGRIIAADDARRIVVVSAPGKRHRDDNKITDLLYLCHAHIRLGVDHSHLLGQVEARFAGIAADLDLSFDVAAAFDEIRRRMVEGAGADWLASRGEALCARLMACCLGYDFLDAQEVIRLNHDGTVDPAATRTALSAAFAASRGRVVIPGFYGAGPDGRVRAMSRGGSDVTGAVAAAALDCDLYENWTDVPGILTADPAIVPNPAPISAISYEELWELTCMGAGVLHEAAVHPVRQAGIPIRIMDTGNPDAPGTLIENAPLPEGGSPVTGIAGRRGYLILDICKCRCQRVAAVMKTALELFARRGVTVGQVLSGADSVSLVMEAEDARPWLHPIVHELEEVCGEGTVQITEGIGLIACVGRELASRPGIAGRLFTALGEEEINIRVISQRPGELTLLVGVAEEDFDRAIRVIHRSLAA